MNELSPASSVEVAADAFLRYLEEERNFAAHTLSAYRRDLQQFIRFLYPRLADPRLPLHLVRPETVSGFVEALRARGLKPTSIARKLAALRSFFRFLCRQQAIAGNPAHGVAQPLPPRLQPISLPSRRMGQVLAVYAAEDFRGTRDRAIVEILYGGGIQLSELVGLNLSALDLADGTVRVIGRGRRERIVPVGRMAQEALSRYLRRRAEQLLDLEITQVEAGALFINGRGRRLTRRTVQRIVERGLEQAAAAAGEDPGNVGTPRGPRVLRHTYAAHMIAAGADPGAVKALLGDATMVGRAPVEKPSLARIMAVYAQAHPHGREDEV